MLTKKITRASQTDSSSLDDDELIEHETRAINRTNKNMPKLRPGIKVTSLNMRGCLKNNKDKLKMVIDWLRINRIAILALQETHLTDEAVEELNEKYEKLKFFGSGLSTSKGGIMFITTDRIGTPKSLTYKTLEQGRSRVLCLDYEGQTLTIVNVYMPNNKPQQKETLQNLCKDLRNHQGIADSELLIVGDWNFMEDKIDRSPQHNDDKGVAREMSRLKMSFDLIDGWRVANPDERRFSWEGMSGNERKKIFSRIDRIYTSRKMWDITNKYKIINCDISDHDGVATTIREASTPEMGKGEAKLNMSIINHPMFRKEADQLINKLEKQIKEYHRLVGLKDKPEKMNKLYKLRTHYNPQKSWHQYKEGLLMASERATKSRRKELTKFRNKAEKDIQQAEKQLKDCIPEKEEAHRKTLSDRKRTLSEYEEETRNTRTHLKDAKWFLTNKKSSKQWFGLFKPRQSSTGIKSLFKSGLEEETETPTEMLKIARDHHSELQ